MARKPKPPTDRTGEDDDLGPGSHAEIFHRTVRYGAEEAKRYYDRLWIAEGDEAEGKP